MVNPLQQVLWDKATELGIVERDGSPNMSELSRRTGMARNRLRDLFQQEVIEQLPQPRTITKLSQALQVSEAQLYDAALRAIGVEVHVLDTNRGLSKLAVTLDRAETPEERDYLIESMNRLGDQLLAESENARRTQVDDPGAKRNRRSAQGRASGSARGSRGKHERDQAGSRNKPEP